MCARGGRQGSWQNGAYTGPGSCLRPVPYPQRDESSTETRDAIRALGRKAVVYTADLSSADDVSRLVPRILADGHEIRILVNCAGIQRRHPCDKFPDSDFNEVRALSSSLL